MNPRTLFLVIWLSPAALWLLNWGFFGLLKLIPDNCQINEGFTRGCEIGGIDFNTLAGWSAFYAFLGLLFVVPWTVILPLAKGLVKLVLAEKSHRKGKDPHA